MRNLHNGGGYVMDLLDKYLIEGRMSLRDEVRKAYSRFEQFGGNVGKINRRTKTMKNPLKLIAWYLVLENENFHRENELVSDRYEAITGGKVLTDSSDYRHFRFIDEIPKRTRTCPTCGGSGEVYK